MQQQRSPVVDIVCRTGQVIERAVLAKSDEPLLTDCNHSGSAVIDKGEHVSSDG